MDGESCESMEPMAEVPLIGLGESELERLVRNWWREAGSWCKVDPPGVPVLVHFYLYICLLDITDRGAV